MSQHTSTQTEIVLLAGTEPNLIFRGIEALHRTELSAGALALMPPGFLQQFYRHIAARDDCIVFAALEGSRLVGFACGATENTSLLRQFAHFARSNPGAIITAAFRLMARPGDIKRLVQLGGWLIRGQSRGGITGPQLLSIAVARTEAARGIGSQLFGCISDEFRRKGIREFVVIAAHTQIAALEFYRKLGCIPVGEIVVGDLPCTVFQYAVAPAPDSARPAHSTRS